MSKLFFKHSSVIRFLIVSMALFTAPRMFGAVYDFTPTDGGLVVNLQPGQRILLSTMVNGQEYFVCHYPSSTGGYFGYTNWDSEKGNFLKLIPQDAGATEPGAPSIWTIEEAVTFLKSGKNYPLDGIAYTMWSSNPGGDSYTLRTSDGNSFRFQGDLTKETNHANICNAIFVVPTNRSTVTTFDPNRTLTTLEGRTDQDAQGRFNGEKGYGFLGMPYSEVYWLTIPRGNEPMSYTNASVVGFNKTLSTIQYSNKEASARPGQALYAFGNKDKHHATPRTIFRLYVLDETVTSTCADSYYFAYDEQDFKQYNKNFAVTPATYTTKKKIYTIDHLKCMERLGETNFYVTDYMFVPEPDSTYYYVGYRNNYCHTDRGDAFNSQFKNIDSLKIHYLGLKAPRGAYGQMMIDVTQTSKQNLGVEFQPGGYFLRTNTGRNIRLIPNADYTTWTCEEMWHITAEWAAMTIKATMFTGSEFSETDPGADIPGWSVPVTGTTVPVVGGGSIIDRDGWARIHVDSKSANGAIEFVPANPDRHIHYNNNGCTGDTIADQYPMHGENSVTIREARLVKGFTFQGWTTNADGTGTLYTPGQVVNLDEGITTLYAKATYTGTIHVALSFVKNDGKRYFLTHPGTAAPRFSRARYINDWTDAYQGMANAENVDNRYINTFKVLTNPDPCAECAVNEVVLDPRREMRYGVKDSLEFYEHFAPAEEEYLGLYYTAPNTVIANNSWAGLFKSTGTTGRNGWPDYTVADVKNAKLSSTHYLHRVDGVITRDERDNSSAPWIAYNAAANQFDGVANEANATVFQISRVRVADEHYVVIPDTTDEWTDEIVFAYHHDEQTVREVQSKLIGKQLKAVTKIDDHVIYFHPDNNKILTSASQLRLDPNYRLVEDFEYIRDSRVDLASVDEENLPSMTGSNFGRTITSGLTSPMDVMYNGEYIDIVDTLRITVRTLGPVKIKEYYGRWRDGAPGLHIRPDGSRYRDIIIRTKTTHYGEDIVHLAITPEYPKYNFYPLAGVSKRLTFTMAKITTHQLLDTDGNVFGEEVLSTVDVTSSLHLGPGQCSFTSRGAYFDVDAGNTLNDHVTLVTKTENGSGINVDTLIINSSATVDAVAYPVTGRVPLQQSALSSSELIWSAVAGGQRYYIMAGSGGLIFRRYELKNNILYKKEDGKTQLIKGSYDAANSRTEYITPWLYTYVNQAEQQLSLTTEYGVNMDFVIDGSSNPAVASSGAATLTYEYVHEYVNDNANFEEQVKLKYGANKWLKFAVVSSTPQLSLTENEDEATVFSWSYLQPEYYIHEKNPYPSVNQLEFGYNSTIGSAVQTRYKAYRIYSMMLDSIVTYCGRVDEDDIADLISAGNDWKTNYAINLISDSRFSAGASGFSKSMNSSTLITTVTPSGTSPRDIRYPAGTGPFVNIVDTLDVVISLQGGAPDYRFASTWSSFSSLEDAHLKIPLIRKTYHTVPHDSIICTVERDEYNYVFPAEVGGGMTHTFTLHTDHRTGTSIMDIDNHVADYTSESHDHTSAMHFDNPALTEIRLIDEYGNTPTWCNISAKGSNTITVRCTQDGIRSPRSAYVYIAYTMNVDDRWRYINFRLGVTQLSKFQYANNQVLIHSKGASGDPLADGVQQVHENRNIIYYYNPSNAARSTDQRVELPVRERNFYGWWRWYSLNAGEEDTDIPAEKWETAPSNTGSKGNFPFRIIGDTIWNDPEDHSKGYSRVATQGRFTIFYNPSADYNARKDPPAKAPMVYPPQNKAVDTFALDKSVYYDNLPLKMNGQIAIEKLDTMRQIIEPTLSLREIYELHPWTERADTLEHYKYAISAPYAGQRYLEDHVVRAPLNARLLLSTEQRYNYDNVKASKHSESMLGYYMKDDNWSTGGWSDTRKDTMIWCGGWDAPCKWYTYNPSTNEYTECTYTITEGNDFLSVDKKTSIPAGKEVDTVIYCLRAQSIKTTTAGTVGDPDPKDPVFGSNMFNICRYVVIYHRTDQYGPKLEDKGEAIITNDEIEQHFEVLERLNFDYNKPGTDYTVYPHPLPWADASYGFAYPRTALLPDNRPHNKNGLTNLANMGEYNLINKIPSFGTYWHKMEQHGGAANGYMIFCDGMSSAGQVAAISLNKKLCEGQKMYFSAYVGNPGNESGKTCPSFLFSVQGKEEKVGAEWEDITSYMTGDLPQSNKWYQIYFPIDQKKDYEHFRVRVYNMAANDDGNDFIIDDMCIFATKPPLIAYQANTTCMKEGETDEITHVVLRVDYKGFHDKDYNNNDVYYTIEHVEDEEDPIFVTPMDGFINQDTLPAVPPATHDMIYGMVHMPTEAYEPGSELVFPNVGDLVDRFEASLGGEPFRIGYIYELLDGELRPVMYMVHKAEMLPRNHYRVRMSLAAEELTSSICAMTSNLKISNRMMLELNGEEQAEKIVSGMCANTTYNVSLRVRGSLLQNNAAPADINGSCYNDWLLYGDSTSTSEATYGYKYSDIEKVIKDILRCDPKLAAHNTNQFAHNLSEVSRSEMGYVKTSENVTLTTSDHPYDVLAHLVNGGFLTLYHSNLLVTTASGDSIQYMIFPIVGTGSDAMLDMEVDVCPTPVFIKLKPTKGGDIPMTLGGFNPNAEPTVEPPVILMTKADANTKIVIPIDSIKALVALDTVAFLSTNDPDYREGVHKLHLVPDRVYDFSSGSDNSGYYKSGEDLILRPAPDYNYQMRAGYRYTFGITMQTHTGSPTLPESDCRVGTVPFTIAVLPSAVQWDPKTGENNSWNNPNNWIGLDRENRPIHSDAHFAPTRVTNVIIPAMEDDLPYPTIPSSISREDSIKQTGFEYNRCNAVRFLPGAAISGQELLTYDNAVVDMGIPKQTWALRSAPVTGMLSGDIYMSDADLMERASPWEVGEFDTNGRNYNTGNASFWLSLFSRETTHYGVGQKDSTATATAEWSKVTNGLTLSLPPAMGWAVYTRTASGNDAAVRLPKNDDIYYYYTIYGEKVYDAYESGLRTKRGDAASDAGAAAAGKLAFDPTGTSQDYTLSNEVAANQFVFGNPSMGYIDIWGFIADNGLNESFDYIDPSGVYTTINKVAANGTPNVITTQARYLPPMHAIVVKLNSSATATSLAVTLNASRVVTSPITPAAPAPARSNGSGVSKGIMTVTAINPVSNRCTSRLLIGQGYSDDVISGEDAVLTTVNIDNFSMTNAPSTPFNIYATEGSYGLSIDLRGDVLNVPVSFYMSELPYDPVTQLWFTGVNNIDGQLVLYDALTDSERLIIDGIRLDIPTPDASHEKRYYIRRRGFDPSEPSNPVATAVEPAETESDPANKIIHNGHVYILRNGHVYTMFGQKLR